ncbi:hypothetical protein D3C76_1166920 [compost metagenome]
MMVQIIGFERRAALRQVSRACAIDTLDRGDAPRDQRRVFQDSDAQCQVIAFAEQIHRAIAQVHLHRDIPIALQKLRQQTPQVRQRKRQRRTHSQGAARFGGLPGDTLLHLLHFTEQAQGRLVVTLSQRRDIQPPGRAIEQAHAQALFELHQAAADKLLGQPQLIGRGGEAAGVHHLAKNTHIFERVHCHAFG